MLPQQVLSTQTIAAAFRYPRNISRTDIVDYALGGVGLNNPSQGLDTNAWRGTLANNTITLETAGVEPVDVYTHAGITRFSFTFDQNMNLFVAFDTEDAARFYWFDTVVAGYVLTVLPAGSQYATCCLDDGRDMQTGASDIILAYLRGGVLYFRAQRDRYTIEYTLGSGLDEYKLHQIGLNEKLRFQFQFRQI